MNLDQDTVLVLGVIGEAAAVTFRDLKDKATVANLESTVQRLIESGLVRNVPLGQKEQMYFITAQGLKVLEQHGLVTWPEGWALRA